MGFNIQEIRKITNFMRKNGILQYRNADFEIKLSVKALKIPQRKSNKEFVPFDKIKMEEAYTEDEILNWSSTPVGVGP